MPVITIVSELSPKCKSRFVQNLVLIELTTVFFTGWVGGVVPFNSEIECGEFSMNDKIKMPMLSDRSGLSGCIE